MFYHIKINYKSLNEQGESVNKNEEYLVKDCELHADAEQRGYEYVSVYQFNEPDITSVKRSNIREFVNENPYEYEDIIYDAIIADVYINEKTGKEKEMKYHVGLLHTAPRRVPRQYRSYGGRLIPPHSKIFQKGWSAP